MTAQEFADNALVQNVSARLQGLIAAVRRVPVNVWRTALIVFALFWISHSLANLFWVLYPSPELPRPATIAQPLTDDAVVVGANVDVALVQSINLSGTPVEAAAAAQAALNEQNAGEAVDLDGPETSLNLKLQGIIANSVIAKGKAVISDSNGQALYQVGETLPQGRNVKLARVLADKVVLDNNGKFETLPLYTDEDFKGTRNIRTSSRPTIPQRRSVSKAPDDVEDDENDTLGDDSEEDDSGIKAQVSPEQLAKAKSINDVVRFSLHREDGEVAGYRIRPGRDRALFDQLGLQSNDVVTSVNGVVINDRNQLREIYRTMRSATEAQLEVNRDGSIIPITISLDTGG